MGCAVAMGLRVQPVCTACFWLLCDQGWLWPHSSAGGVAGAWIALGSVRQTVPNANASLTLRSPSMTGSCAASAWPLIRTASLRVSCKHDMCCTLCRAALWGARLAMLLVIRRKQPLQPAHLLCPPVPQPAHLALPSCPATCSPRSALLPAICPPPGLCTTVMENAPNFKQPKCDHCGEAALHLRACSACKSVRFCSKACQVANWKQGGHKAECATLAAARASRQARGAAA